MDQGQSEVSRGRRGVAEYTEFTSYLFKFSSPHKLIQSTLCILMPHQKAHAELILIITLF